MFLFFSSDTYNSVEEEANKIWKSQRYNLVYEYHKKPLFCPPALIFAYVILFVEFAVRKLVKLRVDRKKASSQKEELPGASGGGETAPAADSDDLMARIVRKPVAFGI